MSAISLLNGNLKFDPRSFSAFPNEPKKHAQSLEELGNNKEMPNPNKFDTVSLSEDAQVYRIYGEVVSVTETYRDPKITEIIENTTSASESSQVSDTYWGYSSESKYSMDRFFFTAGVDFLYEAAEKYAKIEDYQDFKWSVVDSSNFVRSLMDFLDSGSSSGEEFNTISGDLKALTRELAERMKNGESTDLDSLTTTITVKGTDFTISQLVELQQTLQGFSKLADNSEIKDQQTFAKLGLASTIANAIVEKYSYASDEFASSLGSALNNLVDNYSRNVYSQISIDSGKPNAAYTANKAAVGKTVYDMFSNLDYSSKENLIDSYNKQMNTISNMLTDYTKYMSVQTLGKNTIITDIQKAFKTMLDTLYA